MQDNTSRPSVGIDIGTSRVRVAIGQKNQDKVYTIIGVGEAPTLGVRKGNIVDLQGLLNSLDESLRQAEDMSGFRVDQAVFSVNGASLLSTKASGMVAIANGEVGEEDLMRVKEMAKSGKVPANRAVLDVLDHDYIIDGQGDIRDPLGMSGSRLEMLASVVSVLLPNYQNTIKLAEISGVQVNKIVAAPMASAEAVLSRTECENGVMLIDFGAATTGMAIYEEGDLRHAAVLPVGSHNITNDLAIGLQTTPDVAENIKLNYADAIEIGRDKQVSIKYDKVNHEFNLSVVDDVVNARLEEIFDAVLAQLKKAGYSGKLPSGVVLTGGGSCLKNLSSFVKDRLGLAVRLGQPSGFKGVADKIEKPEFSAATGLMLLDENHGEFYGGNGGRNNGFLQRLFAKFKN